MDAPNPSGHQIFVSYSRQDAEWAAAFVAALKKRGWIVFLDARTIKAGDEWSPAIDAAIDAAKVVIVLWSARSVKSSYVIAEVARAAVRGTLIPLSIDRTAAPPVFRRFQTQPMHVAGATALPSDLVSTIEARIAAAAPPSAEEQGLREELARSAAFARERGVPLLALQTLLERLGEVDVAPEAVPARLENFVSEYLKLKTDLASPTNADPDVATTQSRALDLLNAGDLDGARTLIDDALTQRRERYRQTARETATLLADRARIDMMQVRYPEAIASYEEAAGLVSFDAELALHYLDAMVGALIRKGEEFGDNDALVRATETIRSRALPLVSRYRAPLDWAGIQDRLGNALQLLGSRGSSSTDRLQQSVAAYQSALEEYTRDRAPLDWARTQNNMGIALRTLGERESGTVRLEEAATAFRAAMQELTRDRAPLDWAAAQSNLGLALTVLGERERSTKRLDEAVVAYRAALEEQPRDRVPLYWATTQCGMGIALTMLGDMQNDTARLEEAIAAYRAALEENTRDRVPLYWALTLHNLGGALRALGMRQSGSGRLEEAVSVLRAAALEARTRDSMPLLWASTQQRLGEALQELGERGDEAVRFEEAAVAYRSALEVYIRDQLPLRRKATQEALDRTLSLLADRSSR